MTKLKRDYVNLNSPSFLLRKKGRKEEKKRERRGEEGRLKKLDEMCPVFTIAVAVNWQPCIIN